MTVSPIAIRPDTDGLDRRVRAGAGRGSCFAILAASLKIKTSLKIYLVPPPSGHGRIRQCRATVTAPADLTQQSIMKLTNIGRWFEPSRGRSIRGQLSPSFAYLHCFGLQLLTYSRHSSRFLCGSMFSSPTGQTFHVAAAVMRSVINHLTTALLPH